MSADGYGKDQLDRSGSAGKDGDVNKHTNSKPNSLRDTTPTKPMPQDGNIGQALELTSFDVFSDPYSVKHN